MVPVFLQKSQFPLQFVQADLLKFYPPSHGYDQILVIEDSFTKYVALYPVCGKSTVAIARRFEEYLTRFGAPVIWSTDNGGDFKSRLIQALCKVYGTRKQFSLSYHPASNGACERMNRTIIAELAKRINQFGTNWAPQLKWVEFAYNGDKIVTLCLMVWKRTKNTI